MPTAQLLVIKNLWPISDGQSGHTDANKVERYGAVDPKTRLRALTHAQKAKMELFVDCMKRMGVHDQHLTEKGRLCPYRQFDIEAMELKSCARRCICDCAELDALIKAIDDKGVKEIVGMMKAKEVAFIAHDPGGKIMPPCDNCLAWLQEIDMQVFSYHFQLTDARKIPVLNHLR